MIWICACGTAPADTLVVQWGTRRTRGYGGYGSPLAIDTRLRCRACAGEPRTWEENVQRLPVRLNAAAKDRLVRQVLAQVIDEVVGYLPKTDLSLAVRKLTKVAADDDTYLPLIETDR